MKQYWGFPFFSDTPMTMGDCAVPRPLLPLLLPPRKKIIDLNDAFKFVLSVSFRHRITDFVQHVPNRVIRYFNVTLQCFCRNTTLIVTDQVNRKEPLRKWRLALVKDRSRGYGGLAMALFAFEQRDQVRNVV